MATNPCAERVEDLVRFDLMAESLNVGGDGCADIPSLEPGCSLFQSKD
jgi:hypothetical protein